MALRTKTIEYAFAMTPQTATAVARDFTPITVNIPETTSRTIRSVILQISVEDDATAAATISNVLMGITIGAVAISTVALGLSLSNSGESQTYTFTRDVTDYFVTNFTGTSQTVGARLTITGNTTTNGAAKLIITYEYDDSAATTRIKTVKIPIDGNTGALTGTLANVGGVAAQIPALDTFLPEASKVYRDIFFETYANFTALNATVATVNLNMSFDGGGTTVSTIHRTSLNTSCRLNRIDKLATGSGTNATRTVQAASGTAATATFNCLGGFLVVTYEYDHSASTTILNSIQLPAIEEPGAMGGTTVADASVFDRDFFIQESSPTLVQSGVIISFLSPQTATGTVDIRIGAQTTRVFTQAGTLTGGSRYCIRRFDSGAAGGGAGYTLVRGLNTYKTTVFQASGGIPTNTTGIIFLNYTSDKAADGDGVHSHTTQWINYAYLSNPTTLTTIRTQYTQARTPNIPETNYYTISHIMEYFLQSVNAITASGFVHSAEYGAGEGPGSGWIDLYAAIMYYAATGESYGLHSWARARDEFKRHPNDTDTNRMNIETSRSFRNDTLTNMAVSAKQLVTYHSFVYPITVTIQNSTGGTVTVNLHRTDTGEKVLTTSRTGDGDVTLNWYDDTIEVYAVAVDESDGNAITDVAGNATTYSSRLLDFAGGGGGGPTYYAYAG